MSGFQLNNPPIKDSMCMSMNSENNLSFGCEVPPTEIAPSYSLSDFTSTPSHNSIVVSDTSTPCNNPIEVNDDSKNAATLHQGVVSIWLFS